MVLNKSEVLDKNSFKPGFPGLFFVFFIYYTRGVKIIWANFQKYHGSHILKLHLAVDRHNFNEFVPDSYKLAPGGVSGLSTVIYHLVDEKILSVF